MATRTNPRARPRETQGAIKSARRQIHNRIGNFHADQRHDDERDDEGNGAHGNLRRMGLST
jgi:hypothetical protein